MPTGHFIALWASPEPGVSFEGEVAEKLWADQAEGWTISYERFTSQWASYSGTKGSPDPSYVRAVQI